MAGTNYSAYLSHQVVRRQGDESTKTLKSLYVLAPIFLPQSFDAAKVAFRRPICKQTEYIGSVFFVIAEHNSIYGSIYGRMIAQKNERLIYQ